MPYMKFINFNSRLVDVVNFDPFEGLQGIKWNVRVTQERVRDIFQLLFSMKGLEKKPT